MCERGEEDALRCHDEMVNELNENDDGSNRVGASRTIGGEGAGEGGVLEKLHGMGEEGVSEARKEGGLWEAELCERVEHGDGGGGVRRQGRCEGFEDELDNVLEKGGTVLEAGGDHDEGVAAIGDEKRGLETVEGLEDERVDEWEKGGGGGEVGEKKGDGEGVHGRQQ